MITVADLIQDEHQAITLPRCLYSDFESGLIENRRGDRLSALPETLIQGIVVWKRAGVIGVVLFQLRSLVGQNFYAPFCGRSQ